MGYVMRTEQELAELYKHSEMGGQRVGRPPVEIDWNVFEALCAVQCTHDEIASNLKISKACLYDRACEHYKELEFSTIYKTFCSPGKISLRRQQFRQSETNVAMSIWLGKQYLEQHEPYPPKEESKDNAAADALVAALAKAAQTMIDSKKPDSDI